MEDEKTRQFIKRFQYNYFENVPSQAKLMEM
jgi:hypothetical protein